MAQKIIPFLSETIYLAAMIIILYGLGVQPFYFVFAISVLVVLAIVGYKAFAKKEKKDNE